MRTFLGVLVAVALGVLLLVALGWVYFYDDGTRLGVGVNRDEVVEESRELADSIEESARSVGNQLEEATGRDRAESAPAIDADR